MAVTFLDDINVSGGNITIDNTKQLKFGSSAVSINNDAAGRMYFNASLGYYWQTTGGYRMVLDSSGRLGIGTTSPSQALTVSGKGLFATGGSTPDSTTATYEKGITLTGGNQRLVIDVSNVSNGGSYIQTRHSSTSFPTAEYALALNPLGGNVGIGTNGPTEKLEVNGNVLIKNVGANLVIDDTESEGQSPKIDFKQNGSQNGRIMILKNSDFSFETRNSVGNLLSRLFIDGNIGQLQFPAYEATAIANGATAINPNQNFNPSGSRSDTTTDLAIDQGGLVVRTTQEATWELTRAQVDALTTSSAGTTLLSAPGSSNLFIIIEKVTFLIEFVYSGNQMPTNQQYQINQDGNVSDAIAVINGTRINDIAFAGGNSNTSGIYEHDTGFSTLNRTYKPNTATTIRRVNTGALNTAVSTMSIKMRYRVYDTVTF